MNLALPALVILLGLLPGIACFYGYFAGRFDKRTAGVSGVEELALYVIFAIPINAAALWFCRRLGLDFNFNIATHLLAGNIADAPVHGEIATFFQRFAVTSAVAYVAILLVSFAVGSFGRRLVWACRLDIAIPYLRLKHGWFYILQGRTSGMPRPVISYVDVMTRLPDKDGDQTRLFRGLVVDFELSASGTLDSLTLKNAVRGSGRGAEFQWKNIPSTRLMLMGSTIHSINITYFTLDQPGQFIGFRKMAHIWWRSFFHEEP